MVDTIVAQQGRIARAQAKMTGQLVNVLELALSSPEVFTGAVEGRTGEQVRRSLTSELALALHLSDQKVRSLLSTAEVLVAELPDTLRSLKAGRITMQHAECLVRESVGLDREDVKEFERAALEFAETSTPPQLQTKAIRIREGLNPDTITERHTSAVEERRVELWKGHDGMGWVACYGPIDVVQSLHNACHTTAKSLRAAGDERTIAQLMADVFSDATMAGLTREAASEDGDSSRAIRPSVHVTVPVMTLIGLSNEPADLEGYGPIDPDTARRLAAQAPSFTRLLTHPETGAVLSVGRDRYAVPADLRKAIEIRDVTCCFPGCNRPARQCDIDHRVDWQYGGETNIDNCQSMCRSHHTLKHATTWAVERDDSGAVIWTSPLGRSYRIRPESNVGFEPTDTLNGSAPCVEPTVDEEPLGIETVTPSPDDEKWADHYPDEPQF
ncbi:HNH endonuclease signature motif containing protein [Paramicrobacterium humi]|nr:HNH endonuclease signature motif containing protein [Microbacterium humi]